MVPGLSAFTKNPHFIDTRDLIWCWMSWPGCAIQERTDLAPDFGKPDKSSPVPTCIVCVNRGVRMLALSVQWEQHLLETDFCPKQSVGALQAPAQLVVDGHCLQDVLIICPQNRFVLAVVLKLEGHEDIMLTAKPRSVLLPDLCNIIQ
jgi:hypothetical protein